MLKEINQRIAELEGRRRSLEDIHASAQQTLARANATLSHRPLDLVTIREAQADRAAANELADNAQSALKDIRQKIADEHKNKDNFFDQVLPGLKREIESLKNQLPTLQRELADASQQATIAQNSLALTQARAKSMRREEAAERLHAAQQHVEDSNFAVARAERLLAELRQRIETKEKLLQTWSDDPAVASAMRDRFRVTQGVAA